MKYKSIRESDTDFKFVAGVAVVPRAMLHIMPDCPSHVRDTIAWAHHNGYIKSVANVPEAELVWEQLQK